MIMATTSSPLFKRITVCANALRHHKNEKNASDSSPDQVSSYNEVMKFARSDARGDAAVADVPTTSKTRDVTRAALEYLKRGRFALDGAKAKFALYVAVMVAYDNAESGLAKEVCDRFRVMHDFDRHAMEQIFKISLCNDRVRKLLDSVLIKRTGGAPAIDHAFNAEFVEMFFNGVERVVRETETLDVLGYASTKATASDMKLAREIVENHSGDIATRCAACFQKNVLRVPRRRNNLFPAGDAFPQVSIGCEPVQFGGSSRDTVALLKESLADKVEVETGEFLEMMFAAIGLASNPLDPAATYRRLRLPSVRDFFLEKMLDRGRAEETRKAVLASDEARGLYEEMKSLRENNLGLKNDYYNLKQELALVEKRLLESGDICRKFAKQIPALKEKSDDLERENKRLQLSLAIARGSETALHKKLTREQKADKIRG